MTATAARRNRSGWVVPVALVVLSAVPIVAGTIRLVEIAGGPHLMPANPRIDSAPAPVVLHIVTAAIYGLGGAFQFSGRVRRRWPAWHRKFGRILITAAMGVALSALWMTLFYRDAPGGALLWSVRLLVGSMMSASIVLGVAAIRRHDFGAHRAWMIRAYALASALEPRSSLKGSGRHCWEPITSAPGCRSARDGSSTRPSRNG